MQAIHRGLVLAAAALLIGSAAQAQKVRKPAVMAELLTPLVVKELAITDGQQGNILTAINQYAAARKGVKDKAELQTVRQEFQASLKTILTEDQQLALEDLRLDAADYIGLPGLSLQLASLKLTDEQSAKIKTTLAKYGAELKALSEQVKASGDKKAVAPRLKELTKQRQDEVLAVLTDEQKAQLSLPKKPKAKKTKTK